MTATQVKQPAPTTTPRSWWPDQRPIQAWWAVSSLVQGLVLAIGTVATGLAGVSSFQDTAPIVVLGLGGMAQAGLEVARPRPGPTFVLVYRVAYFGVPLVVAAVAIALILTPGS